MKKRSKKRVNNKYRVKPSKLNEDVADRLVKEVVAYQFNIKESSLNDDTRLDSLGADSLDILEIIMDLEDEISNEILTYRHSMDYISIPDKDAAKWETIGDMKKTAIEYAEKAK